MECMEDLYVQTPNQYLKYRLESLLVVWRDILHVNMTSKQKPRRETSSSVFEAIIKDDDHFFRTKSVLELLHRLLQSFDKNYKVNKTHRIFDNGMNSVFLTMFDHSS